MVFQRFNLFPHLTALENIIEAPIRVKGVPRPRLASAPCSCWSVSGLGDKGVPTRPSSPAASSSGWPSRGRSPWNPS